MSWKEEPLNTNQLGLKWCGICGVYSDNEGYKYHCNGMRTYIYRKALEIIADGYVPVAPGKKSKVSFSLESIKSLAQSVLRE